MADEYESGVRHFDLHIGGSSSAVSGMLDEGIFDPFENWFALSDVKDPKQWWGGHMWVDNAQKFIYMFQAYLTESIWLNTELAKPTDFRSYDDFLQPKGKAGSVFSIRARRAQGIPIGRICGPSKARSI